MDQSARKLDVSQRRAVTSRVRGELVKTIALLAALISRNQAISPFPVWRTSLVAATSPDDGSDFLEGAIA
jgi:hypothetical protein